MLHKMGQLTACGQEHPLDFLAIFPAKIAEFWHVGFLFT